MLTRVSLFGHWPTPLDLEQTGDPPLASVEELLRHAEDAIEAGLLLAATAYARAALETRLRELVVKHTDADLPEVAGTARMLAELGRVRLLDAEQRRFLGVTHARACAVVHNRSARLEDFYVAYRGCLFACQALATKEGGAQ